MCRGRHVAIVVEKERAAVVEMKGCWIVLLCADVIVAVQLGVMCPGMCQWYQSSKEKRWMVRRAMMSVATHPRSQRVAHVV